MLSLEKNKLIEITQLAADNFINAFREIATAADPTTFLFNTLSTFIYLDNKIDLDEYSLFNQSFGRYLKMEYADFVKRLRDCKSNRLTETIRLVELVVNRFDQEIGGKLKDSLLTLGLAFSTLDGRLSDKEIELLSYYLK